MKFYYLPFVCLIVCIVGCLKPKYKDSYQVYIDPYFTNAQVIDIGTAAETWENATSDPIDGKKLFLELIIGSCPKGRNETICIVNDSGLMATDPNFEGFTQRNEEEDFSTIYIADNFAWQNFHTDFTMLIAHEMGHAFGCHHTLTGLMYYLIYPDTTITCGDVAQYESFRNQSNITTMCPDGGSFQLDPDH